MRAVTIEIGQTSNIESTSTYSPVDFVAAGTPNVTGSRATATPGSITTAALNVSAGATLMLSSVLPVPSLNQFNIGNDLGLLSAFGFVPLPIGPVSSDIVKRCAKVPILARAFCRDHLEMVCRAYHSPTRFAVKGKPPCPIT
jgi:hypothetical protein